MNVHVVANKQNIRKIKEANARDVKKIFSNVVILSRFVGCRNNYELNPNTFQDTVTSWLSASDKSSTSINLHMPEFDI